jgi:hypothetical protein
MERTTLSTYPNLLQVKPITGTVYKPRLTLLAPRPRMTPMSVAEVQEHEKNEALDTLEVFGAPSVSVKRQRVRLQKKRPMQERADTASAARKMKTHLFGRKASKEEGVSRFQQRNGGIQEPLLLPRAWNSTSSESTSSLGLTTGVHCATDGCLACQAVAPTSGPERHIIQQFHQPLTSLLGSGFTTSDSSSSSSHSVSQFDARPFLAAIENANANEDIDLDLDVFQDFDGTWIEEDSDEDCKGLDRIEEEHEGVEEEEEVEKKGLISATPTAVQTPPRTAATSSSRTSIASSKKKTGTQTPTHTHPTYRTASAPQHFPPPKHRHTAPFIFKHGSFHAGHASHNTTRRRVEAEVAV